MSAFVKGKGRTLCLPLPPDFTLHEVRLASRHELLEQGALEMEAVLGLVEDDRVR